MGREDSAEDIPYLTPATAPSAEDEVSRDEEEFSSLQEVKRTLDEALDALKFDFTDVDDKNDEDLRVEVRSRKKARDFIEPVKDFVDEAIKKVEQKRKGVA